MASQVGGVSEVGGRPEVVPVRGWFGVGSDVGSEVGSGLGEGSSEVVRTRPRRGVAVWNREVDRLLSDKRRAGKLHR